MVPTKKRNRISETIAIRVHRGKEDSVFLNCRSQTFFFCPCCMYMFAWVYTHWYGRLGVFLGRSLLPPSLTFFETMHALNLELINHLAWLAMDPLVSALHPPPS